VVVLSTCFVFQSTQFPFVGTVRTAVRIWPYEGLSECTYVHQVPVQTWMKDEDAVSYKWHFVFMGRRADLFTDWLELDTLDYWMIISM